MNGHYLANLDPLGLDHRPPPLELDPALYGFTEADLDRECVPPPHVVELSARLRCAMLWQPILLPLPVFPVSEASEGALQWRFHSLV